MIVENMFTMVALKIVITEGNNGAGLVEVCP